MTTSTQTPFALPGAPVTGEAPFRTLHVVKWARSQDKRADVTMDNYLSAVGFVVGRDRLDETQYDVLHGAIEHFHRVEPHLKGEHKFSDLFTLAPKGSGFWVKGVTDGPWIPAQALVDALVASGWIYDVTPDTTYFNFIAENCTVWAEYQQIIGSRPLARIVLDEVLQ